MLQGSDTFWGATEIPNGVWAATYIVPSLILLFIAFVYIVFVSREFKTQTPKLPGWRSAQIIYIVAVLVRGVGWLVWGILIVTKNTDSKDTVDTLVNGLPGYFLTISYCFMFFLWCSISVNLIMNDTSDLYYRLRNWHIISLVVVSGTGVALVIGMGAAQKDLETLHHCEIWFAVVRDMFTGCFFLVFTRQIIRMMRTKLCDRKSNEAGLCRMSLQVATSLLLRAISILAYFYGFVFKKSTEVSRWQAGSFVNTVLSALACELWPILVIFFGHKRSGLLSVYDAIDV